MKTKYLKENAIAKNIRQLRLAADLTQLELAKKLSVSISSVKAWESKKVFPSLINILSICNLFNTKVDDFIGFLPMKDSV